ncbi:hypothetical protein [Bradyrhizobium sp. USDA 4452]
MGDELVASRLQSLPSLFSGDVLEEMSPLAAAQPDFLPPLLDPERSIMDKPQPEVSALDAMTMW